MSRLSVAGAAFAMAVLLGAGPVHAFGSSDSESVASDPVKDAVASIKDKDYKAAIKALDRALAADSRNADAMNYMGYSYRKLGQYDKAVEYYRRALAIDPAHKGALEYLGEAYLDVNQPDKAEANLKKLAALCNADCVEYRTLKKAIDAFRMRSGAKG